MVGTIGLLCHLELARETCGLSLHQRELFIR
jgi:hypothetical protein